MSGWTLAAYLGQIIFDNIQSILMSYQTYILMYVLASSIISFSICYYKGPPKNTRSQDLIKWSLQLLGLLMIFFCSDLREATLGIIAASFFLYYVPLDFFGGIRRFWRRKFPQKRRLLTQEEYEEQGRIETEKELTKLREYLKSPKCKEPWKIARNLTNPGRFASFVEGDEHVTFDETINHENAMMPSGSDEETSDDQEEVEEEENIPPMNNSRLSKLQNGNTSSRYRSITQVASSTPNRQLRNRTQNVSSSTRITSFEISDDE